MAENIQNAELKPFMGRINPYYYVPRMLLSIEDASRIFAANNIREGKMLETLTKVRSHHYGHMQVPIPVYNIKHVTVKTALDGICSEEGFRKTQSEPRPEFRDLSYWSADITSEDLEQARQEAYEKVSKIIDLSGDKKIEEDLKGQFGNSPAFREEASRYGNFKFSFPLSYLLDLYKDQHCGGREPQLRVLSTELYRLKIAHYVVVHSPDTDKFNGFPEVPTVQGGSDPLPFVYWMEGSLTWRPESSSIPLKVTISQDGSVRGECYRRCEYFIRDGKCFHTDDGIYGVWNHLIVAFHLPKGHLKVPKEQLVKNLSSCTADVNYLKDEVLSREAAEENIQKMKEEAGSGTCS